MWNTRGISNAVVNGKLDDGNLMSITFMQEYKFFTFQTRWGRGRVECKVTSRSGWHCLSDPSCQSSLKTYAMSFNEIYSVQIQLYTVQIHHFTLNTYWFEWCSLYLQVNGVEMVILASRPVGGYLRKHDKLCYLNYVNNKLRVANQFPVLWQRWLVFSVTRRSRSDSGYWLTDWLTER